MLAMAGIAAPRAVTWNVEELLLTHDEWMGTLFYTRGVPYNVRDWSESPWLDASCPPQGRMLLALQPDFKQMVAVVARSKGMTMEEFFEMVAERGMEMAMQGMGI